MPDADLTEAVIAASQRLISASRSGDVDGEDVAREIGRSTDDMDVYYAFQEAKRRGVLDMHFRGGMGLPSIVRLPPG